MVVDVIIKEDNHDAEKQHHEHKHTNNIVEDDEEDHEGHIHGCCNHCTEEAKFNWFHPVIHSLKIIVYIFIINLIFGGIVELVGEAAIINFLNNSSALQPIFAVLVGLIPNCASSVILTQLYLAGGISFGAIVAGLSVNAGLGFMVLFKNNKNIKQNVFIMIVTTIPSLIIGYIIHFIPQLF